MRPVEACYLLLLSLDIIKKRIKLKFKSPGLRFITYYLHMYPFRKYLFIEHLMRIRPWARCWEHKDDKSLCCWRILQSIIFPWDNASKAITKDYKSPGEAQQSQPRGDGGGQIKVLGGNAQRALKGMWEWARRIAEENILEKKDSMSRRVEMTYVAFAENLAGLYVFPLNA